MRLYTFIYKQNNKIRCVLLRCPDAIPNLHRRDVLFSVSYLLEGGEEEVQLCPGRRLHPKWCGTHAALRVVVEVVEAGLMGELDSDDVCLASYSSICQLVLRNHPEVGNRLVFEYCSGPYPQGIVDVDMLHPRPPLLDRRPRRYPVPRDGHHRV